MEHLDFIEISKPFLTGAFSIASAVGEYSVEFEEGIDYDKDPSEFSLRIVEIEEETKIRIFDFGPIEGMMYIDTDRPRLLTVCLEADEDDYEDGESDAEGDMEEVSGQDGELMGHNLCSSRTTKCQASTIMPPAKSVATASMPPLRRVYFQWRGCEIGEGEIQLDEDQWGQLDFIDNACTRFKGRISFDSVGHNLPFTGYKTSNQGGEVTEAWCDLGESTHAYAEKARWR